LDLTVDGTHPSGECVLVTGQVLDHPGDPGTVADCGVQFGTAGADRSQLLILGWFETPR
jgi:hypothetical protein